MLYENGLIEFGRHSPKRLVCGRKEEVSDDREESATEVNNVLKLDSMLQQPTGARSKRNILERVKGSGPDTRTNEGLGKPNRGGDRRLMGK